MSGEALRKVASVVLAGQELDLAKNGEHFHLVVEDGNTAYGHPIHRRVALPLCDDYVQGLLDQLGAAKIENAELRAALARSES